jgi:hypothetical protein
MYFLRTASILQYKKSLFLIIKNPYKTFIKSKNFTPIHTNIFIALTSIYIYTYSTSTHYFDG